MHSFELKSEFIPLNKLLKACGIVQTGGEAAIRITQGEVLVDGQTETRKRRKIVPGAVVTCAGETITVTRSDSEQS